MGIRRNNDKAILESLVNKYGKNNLLNIINEGRVKKWYDGGIAVMFNRSGNYKDPWYFGYTHKEVFYNTMTVWNSIEGGMTFDAKIVVPFEDFDPMHLDMMHKFNLLKTL